MATVKTKPAKKPSKAVNRNGRVVAAAPPGEVMTLAETAIWMQCTDEVIAKMAAEGAIPAKRVGDAEWRFSRLAILAWLATPQVPAEEPFVRTWPPDEMDREFMRFLEESRGRPMFEGLL